MSDEEVLIDAIRTLAAAAGEIKCVPDNEVTRLQINDHLPRLHRSIAQLRSLLLHTLPLNSEPLEDIDYRLRSIFEQNNHHLFALLGNSLLIGLKLYQHPEIEIAFSYSNDEVITDETDDQGENERGINDQGQDED